jgi:hypothetical protein
MRWFQKDRNDLALLHDAFKLRLRYGVEAENFCEQALRAAPINPRGRRVITELLGALAHVSPKIETYKQLRDLHGGPRSRA